MRRSPCLHDESLCHLRSCVTTEHSPLAPDPSDVHRAPNATDALALPITSIPLGGARPDAILLFGGTFDPPHRAHIDLPLQARLALARQLNATVLLIYIPTARSPHKATGPIASDSHRAAMLTLALAEANAQSDAGIWADELDRARVTPGAPSFSIDTARRARRWLDDHGLNSIALRWLIGADQAIAFHRWKNARELIALAEPLVMVRSDADHAEAGCSTASESSHLTGVAGLLGKLARTGAWSPAEFAAWSTRIAPTSAMNISATQTRGWLAAPEKFRAELAASIHRRVLEYIAQEHLYESRDV